MFTSFKNIKPKLFTFEVMKFNWAKIITNKYIIATLAFVALLFFSDRNNVIDQYKLRKQHNKVKAEHTFYQHQIEDAKKQRDELFTSDKNLEKFAREKYLMKKEDEDVFVFVKKDSIN
jgi:cell division protein FtsB